jgi:hypothetical protein
LFSPLVLSLVKPAVFLLLLQIKLKYLYMNNLAKKNARNNTYFFRSPLKTAVKMKTSGPQKPEAEFNLVGMTGFEPATSRTPSVRATRLRYIPNINLQV